MMFRSMHMDGGVLHDLFGDDVRVALFRISAVIKNHRHTFRAVAVVANEMAVLAFGIGRELLAAAGAFGLLGCLAINKWLATDKASFFKFNTAHFL